MNTIDVLYVVFSVDKNGQEKLFLTTLGSGTKATLVTSDEGMLQKFLPLAADEVARSGQQIRVVEFKRGEVLEGPTFG